MGDGMVDSAITLSGTALTPALQGNQQLRNTLADSAARLTSGNRILNIADDAGSAITAARLQSQSAGFRQASSNAARGVSLLEVASDGLDQISDIVANLEELAEQATGTSLLDTERALLQQQFSQQVSRIDEIANGTTFNGISLLTGFTADFRIGLSSDDSINVDIGSVTSEALFDETLPSISTIANATTAQDAVEDANNI